MELVEFVRSRLDEDEQAARAADVKQGDPQWWPHPVALAHPRTFHVRSVLDSRPIAVVQDVAGDAADDPTGILDGAAVAEHIARWDPARVLAEVEAKRAILDEHPSAGPIDEPGSWSRTRPWCPRCSAADEGPTFYPCATVRLLALPYRGHLDYRPEWAPSSKRETSR